MLVDGWYGRYGLAGMFGIIATLGVVTAVAPNASDALSDWFSPALNWIQKWLPLFYVPSLVVLPLVVQGIPGEALHPALLEKA